MMQEVIYHRIFTERRVQEHDPYQSYNIVSFEPLDLNNLTEISEASHSYYSGRRVCVRGKRVNIDDLQIHVNGYRMRVRDVLIQASASPFLYPEHVGITIGHYEATNRFNYLDVEPDGKSFHAHVEVSLNGEKIALSDVTIVAVDARGVAENESDLSVRLLKAFLWAYLIISIPILAYSAGAFMYAEYYKLNPYWKFFIPIFGIMFVVGLLSSTRRKYSNVTRAKNNPTSDILNFWLD